MTLAPEPPAPVPPADWLVAPVEPDPEPPVAPPPVAAAEGPRPDDVPVTRDITTSRVLALLAGSMALLLGVGAILRALDLQGPAWPLIVGSKLFTASVALTVVDHLGWWRRVGFRRPSRWRRLGLAWVPLLYLGILFASAFTVGAGVPIGRIWRTVAIATLTLAVGLDEEVWTRGLLLESLRHRGTTAAVVWSAVAFGVLHSVNAVVGQPVSSTLVQMMVATSFGLGLGALRVRCHSIWPCILVHAAWDFAAIARTGTIGTTEGTTAGVAFHAFLLFLPLALYGLVLARRSKVPGPDGRIPRPDLDLPALGAGPRSEAPYLTPAGPEVDALGRWPGVPPDVEAIRRGW